MGDQALVKAYIICIDGEFFELPAPESFVINRETGAADDLSIVFSSCDIEKTGGSKIQLYVDDRIEFSGIIDELKTTESSDGTKTLIYARSNAALLLDNEAMPVDYKNADGQLIASRHILPLGLDYVCEDNGEIADISIYKGTSHWQVIKNFCSLCYANEPYVDEEGRVIMCRDNSAESLDFCNNGGIGYTNIQVNKKYYKLISDVFTKASTRSDYDIELINPVAFNLGLSRTRYVDGAISGNDYGDRLIDAGNEESLEVKVYVPQFLHCPIGGNCSATLEDGQKYDGLKCRKIKQSLSNNGFETAVVLTGEIGELEDVAD